MGGSRMRKLIVICCALLAASCSSDEEKAEELAYESYEGYEEPAAEEEEPSLFDDQANEPESLVDALPDPSFGRGGYVGGSLSRDIDNEEREPFDERAARRAAERKLARDGYDYSYGCTIDCSGHEAGWQWRADNGYATPGRSQSFEEGGNAFDEALERRVDRMRDDYEAGEDQDY